MPSCESHRIQLNLDSVPPRVVVILVSILCIFLSANPVRVTGNEIPAFNRGEDVVLECYLLQNGTYGDPVPNQRVEFYDHTCNVHIGSSVTDDNGFASILWQIPITHPLGETSLNITFRGNESLALSPSVQWIVIAIISSTTIVSNVENTHLHPHDTLNLSAHLMNDNGTPVDYQYIEIISNGTTLHSGITNTDGLFQARLQCNSSWATIGYNTLDIVYAGNSSRYLESSYTDIGFTLEKKKTEITISQNDTLRISLNDTCSLSVVLASGEEFLKNESLELKIDNENHERIFTTNSGSAYIDMHINESFALGTHTLSIHYLGSERYSPSSLTQQIIVSSPCFVNGFENISLIANSPNKLKIGICDAFSRPIELSNVILTDSISRKNASGNSEGEGIYSFTISPKDSLGNRNLLLTISNESYVDNCTHSIPISVWSRPDFKFLYCNVMGHALPGQNVSFMVSLNDFYGPVAHKNIQLLLNEKEYDICYSDEKGEISACVEIPTYVGLHSIALYYRGNKSAFILERTLIFSIMASHNIPVVPWSVSSKILPMEKRICVTIMVIALNGSKIEGLKTTHNWLGKSYQTKTMQNGILDLSLPIPNSSGTYNLTYHIHSSKGTKQYDGSVQIEVTSLDVTHSSGFGFLPFVLTIVFSFSLVMLPSLRRKYLIG